MYRVLHPAVAETETVVACDVNNPLTGPNGASHVYGPQKGATPEMIETLDAHLAHFDGVLTRTLGKSFNDIPGAGAAGGLGAGLMAFLNAELRLGVDIMVDAVNLRERVKGAAIVFTGEGQLDFQTVFGKTPVGVAKVAKTHDIPVIAIAGGIAEGADTVYEAGIDAMLGIVQEPMELEDAVADAARLIADTAEQAARLIIIGHSGLGKLRKVGRMEAWKKRRLALLIFQSSLMRYGMTVHAYYCYGMTVHAYHCYGMTVHALSLLRHDGACLLL